MPSSLITLWSAPDRHPCPSSLAQHVLICCLFVGPRTAYIRSSPIQWSALVLHWQEISLNCLSSQLLTHFPHWYSVLERGIRERWEGFQFGCGHVVHLCMWAHVERTDHCSCWRWMKSPHILLGANMLEKMKIWSWPSCQLTHIKTSVTAVIL